MGFYFRKSVNFGPFRVNLSQRGIGYSVGERGFRVGSGANGRKYVSAGLPGTGFGYRTNLGGPGSKFGCLVMLVAFLSLLTAGVVRIVEFRHG